MAPDTFTRSLHSDPHELERLLPDLATFLDRHGVEASVTYIVQLVVEELVLNVIKHGGKANTTRAIALRLQLNDSDHAVLEVEDDGAPFDPREAPEPVFEDLLKGRRNGGLGVHLVRSLAASLDYQRIGERNRVRVRILPLPAANR